MGKYVIIVGIDAKNNLAYGVMNKTTYERWLAGEVETTIKDAYNLLYGGSDLVETFLTWEGATQHISECEGVLNNVVACVQVGA